MVGKAGNLRDMGADRHLPVLLDEVLAVLDPQPQEVFVDGTFGAGGYSRAILQRADTQVIGIDRDPTAASTGAAFEDEFAGRFQFKAGCFADMEGLVDADAVDGVALDVGVSSMQLDEASRGFSFLRDGPLDMRMGGDGPSAADVVNTFEVDRLKHIIKVLGEEKRAHVISRAIDKARQVAALKTTLELAETIENAVGGRQHGKGKAIHPATRTFQALRIFVNDELGQLVFGLGAAERLLKPGGRLAVVSFHSLEDRIVKQFFKARTGKTANPSRHMPEAPKGPQASFIDLTRGGIVPGDDEVERNPRARSARLRAGKRTRAPAIKTEIPAIVGIGREGAPC